MAKPVDRSDLEKISKAIEAAMKLDAKQAKKREDQRKKALADLEGFKKNYAERRKELKAGDRKTLEGLERADGIAENELPEDHPVRADIDDCIQKVKAVGRDTIYTDMDKAIDALDDWDTSLEKQDLPKQAIASLKKSKDALDADHDAVDKAVEAYEKALAKAVKDLDSIEDPDVKKRLKAIFEGG